MTKPFKTIEEVFPIPAFNEKPRKLRQTWLKDVGYDEAPWYVERMGLVELEDFLEVSARRLDYVKICTPQVLYSPSDWLKRKLEVYRKHQVEPYLDHTYFKRAFSHGVVDDAIIAGASLGFRVIEFMNTFGDVSPEQWKTWRQLALDLDMRIIYEHHPERNWNPDARDVPSKGEDIVAGAIPFLEHGAFTLLLDHEEIEIQGDQAKTEISKVIDELGLENIIFEVTSPKEGPMRWHEDLSRYFELFGGDINVSNIMPSQAMFVETMREV